MQDIWLSLNDHYASHTRQQSISMVASKLEEYLKHIKLEVNAVESMYKQNLEDCVVESAISNIGYRLMALGVWCNMFSPYRREHVLDNMCIFAKDAKRAPLAAMGHWIFALSLGLEYENLEDHPGWKVLDTAVPRVVLGSPDTRSSMDE